MRNKVVHFFTDWIALTYGILVYVFLLHPRAPTSAPNSQHTVFWISSKVTHFSHVGEHDQAHLVAPPVFSVATSHSCSGSKFNRFQIPSKVAHFARREFNDLSNLFVLQCFCAPVVANSRWGVPKRSCAFLASQIPRPRTSCKLFCLSCNFPTSTTLAPKKSTNRKKAREFSATMATLFRIRILLRVGSDCRCTKF